MKKFISGLTFGLIIGGSLIFASIGMAANNIKLIINGQEIKTDVPPQNIGGRVLIPARFVAEALHATVQWDAKNNAVVITSTTAQGPKLDQEKIKESLSNLVEDGTITQTQADSVIAYLEKRTQEKPSTTGDNQGQKQSPLAELVTNGTITQEQADKIAEAIFKPQGNQKTST